MKFPNLWYMLSITVNWANKCYDENWLIAQSSRTGLLLLYWLLSLQYGRTPLYKASKGGHLQIMKLLLSKGAEVDSKDKVSKYIVIM